jgi:hypothetical protein
VPTLLGAMPAEHVYWQDGSESTASLSRRAIAAAAEARHSQAGNAWQPASRGCAESFRGDGACSVCEVSRALIPPSPVPATHER